MNASVVLSRPRTVRAVADVASAYQFLGSEADPQLDRRVENCRLLPRRDTTARQPPLHGGVVKMAEGACQLTEAAKPFDDKGGGVHAANVRPDRTAVNIENVHDDMRLPQPMAMVAIGPAMRALRERAGLSYRDLAGKMGYKNPSSIQHLFADDYREGRVLDLDVARKFAGAVIGLGEPPIMPDEVFSLAGMVASSIEAAGTEGAAAKIDRNALPPLQEMPRDVPVYGTAIGAPLEFTSAGSDAEGFLAVEQTSLDRSEPIDYLRRTPAMAKKRDIYGILVIGSSMAPRFDDGDTVVVDPHYPPKIGDDVIVQLVGPNGQDGEERVVSVLIKRLVRRSASWVELEQFNPAATFRIDMARVRSIHRIVPLGQIIGI